MLNPKIPEPPVAPQPSRHAEEALVSAPARVAPRTCQTDRDCDMEGETPEFAGAPVMATLLRGLQHMLGQGPARVGDTEGCSHAASCMPAQPRTHA